MGYTQHTIDLIERNKSFHNTTRVCDLGSQQLYNQPLLPAPYTSEFYSKKGLHVEGFDRTYYCIDLNAENHAYPFDLSIPLPSNFISDNIGGSVTNRMVDLLVDAGTSEHVGTDGKFNWESIYNCWLNKHNLLISGGIMVNENPKSGHWEGHGFQWYTEEFYKGLMAYADYKILELGEVCAMGNCTTGKNIYCVLEKTGDRFPTLEQFKTLDLKNEFIPEVSPVVIQNKCSNGTHAVEGKNYDNQEEFFDGKVCDCGLLSFFKEPCSCPTGKGWRVASKPANGY